MSKIFKKRFHSKMDFQPLPNHNGKRYLPVPSGKYMVGTSDLMTATNVFLRCYYPTEPYMSSSDQFKHIEKFSHWLPALEYADGYMRFKFSQSVPFLARIFRWLVHDPLCPNIKDAPLITCKEPIPVIIFSHGMGAMRTTYSILLSKLASEGYFVAAVEHRDGSAAATINDDKTWTFERKLQPNEDEYDVRNKQVTQRVEECEKSFRLLQNISQKNETASTSWRLFQPSKEFLESISKTSLDIENGCLISGHSFGSATAVKAMYTSKIDDNQFMFKEAILFDSWMFPIREEAENLASKRDIKSELLFINCQRFQGASNLRTMNHFEQTDNSGGSSNVITLRDAMHYAPCDIPTVFMGSYARLPFSWLFRMNNRDIREDGDGEETASATERPVPASMALGLCCDLAMKYLRKESIPASLQRYLIYGTSYLDQY